jgi:hypothetical protein
MRGAIALQVEAGVDMAAAASFAAALAFSCLSLVPGAFAPACAAVLAALGFVISRKALNRVGSGREPFAVPIFDVREIEPLEALPRDELLLTDSDRLQDPEALVLDDVLAGIAPDSGVVQLFDPAAMPTPGQLKARIDGHLDGGTSHFASPDASEALFEALADLRRSLR